MASNQGIKRSRLESPGVHVSPHLQVGQFFLTIFFLMRNFAVFFLRPPDFGKLGSQQRKPLISAGRRLLKSDVTWNVEFASPQARCFLCYRGFFNVTPQKKTGACFFFWGGRGSWKHHSSSKKQGGGWNSMIRIRFQRSHKKNRGPLLSMKYWLFNRNPYVMAYEIIPTLTG